MRTLRLIVWIFLSFCLLPWTSAETQRLTREEFQAKKNAYIVQQASLSEKESAQFFPLYREMRRKIGRINREISRQERELSKVGCYSEERYKEAMDCINNSRIEAAKIEKEYTEKFRGFLSNEKIFKIHMAEIKFHRDILKKMIH